MGEELTPQQKGEEPSGKPLLRLNVHRELSMSLTGTDARSEGPGAPVLVKIPVDQAGLQSARSRLASKSDQMQLAGEEMPRHIEISLGTVFLLRNPYDAEAVGKEQRPARVVRQYGMRYGWAGREIEDGSDMCRAGRIYSYIEKRARGRDSGRRHEEPKMQ